MAVVVRVAADLSDAVLVDRLQTEPKTRGKIATLAAAWGVLCALSGLTIRSAEEKADEDESAEAKAARRCRRDRGELRDGERSSPLRRWVSGIVDEELRETGVIE
ncbi:hypothetical protein [Saccharopolyspora phatthalungensis]|uniref:Uncharacterized protein n=1 Tax=Saccharopolyspora phatthalungensis TaxID=664693 RepID=A0A840QII1_9PSEU|nr:hypothetical protein [Saccharopolyspora phatthalungensis]MBB5158539.1 hypothetical protein [Saccharopolyspora phatthalungensis]